MQEFQRRLLVGESVIATDSFAIVAQNGQKPKDGKPVLNDYGNVSQFRLFQSVVRAGIAQLKAASVNPHPNRPVRNISRSFWGQKFGLKIKTKILLWTIGTHADKYPLSSSLL